MSRFSRGYISTHDIDWFCKINNKYVHIGSCGGKLPPFAKERNILREIQYNVDALPETYNTEINGRYIQALLQFNNNSQVTVDSFGKIFRHWAARGFYSFYRDLIRHNEEDESYSLIAWPTNLKNNSVEDREKQQELWRPVEEELSQDKYLFNSDIIDMNNPLSLCHIRLDFIMQ